MFWYIENLFNFVYLVVVLLMVYDIDCILSYFVSCQVQLVV